MPRRRLSNTIGFDDGAFPRDHCGPVPVIGAVFADQRFDGVVMGEIEKDGDDAARALIRVVCRSRFREHIRLVLLQGIAFGGFNVVDAELLSERLDVPVLVVARRVPDYTRIRRALARLPGGERKWALIEKLGPMEACRGVRVQRVGLTLEDADAVLERLALHGAIPEPLRVAHLIAGALTRGESRGRA